MSISACPSIAPERRRGRPALRLFDHCWVEEAAEQQRHQRDHDRAADELAGGELPADQDREDDPELDHEVRGGELERHRGGEVGALAKQRAGQRDRGVGAADEDAAPSPVATVSVRGESSGSSRRICCLATTACTAAERANPRISAHKTSQVMPKANCSASPKLVRTATSITELYERLRTCVGRFVPGDASVVVVELTGRTNRVHCHIAGDD